MTATPSRSEPKAQRDIATHSLVRQARCHFCLLSTGPIRTWCRRLRALSAHVYRTIAVGQSSCVRWHPRRLNRDALIAYTVVTIVPKVWKPESLWTLLSRSASSTRLQSRIHPTPSLFHPRRTGSGQGARRRTREAAVLWTGISSTLDLYIMSAPSLPPARPGLGPPPSLDGLSALLLESKDGGGVRPAPLAASPTSNGTGKPDLASKKFSNLNSNTNGHDSTEPRSPTSSSLLSPNHPYNLRKQAKTHLDPSFSVKSYIGAANALLEKARSSDAQGQAEQAFVNYLKAAE